MIVRRTAPTTFLRHTPKAAFLLLSLALIASTGCGGGSRTGSGAVVGGGGLSVTLSAPNFDFGSVPVNTQSQRLVLTVTNQGFNPVNLKPTLSGTLQGSLSPSGSCGSSIAAAGVCTFVFSFSPTTPGAQASTLDLGLSGPANPPDQTFALSGTGVPLVPGASLVQTTNNPLVALYTWNPPTAGQVYVEFGTSTSYGFKTSSIASPAGGGPVTILVAGMRGNTLYHMRASVLTSSGTVESDSDQTFTTTNFPTSILPTLAVTTNGTPQPGVEFIDANIGTNPNYLPVYATDLQGNVIWGYNYPDRGPHTIIQPIKPLPNGDFVLSIEDASTSPVAGSLTGSEIDLREINLAGDPVRGITGDQLNQRLAAAGFNLTIEALHHDIAILPNGDWIVIGNTVRNITGTGNVIGDALIELDQNLNPVWVWNEFDHLDVNRRPANFPDWTHSNALLYSPSDGDLLLAIRHQGWIIKIDYANRAGTNNVLWHLGAGGDFTLTNGTDPIDWPAGEHQPAFFGPATSGVFSLAMMDNGFNRELSPGTYCNEATGVPCYTTVPILQLDEKAKTATFLFHQTFPTAQYSFFGGGTTALANGNLEYDLCVQNKSDSEVDEVPVNQGNSPAPVWTMKVTGENLYRANRMPSLYPGVQW